MILVIARMNFMAGPPEFRFECQSVKTSVKLPEIFVSLLASPSVLGISSDGLKIGKGF